MEEGRCGMDNGAGIKGVGEGFLSVYMAFLDCILVRI